MSNRAKEQAVENTARDLYLAMPGARLPPKDDHGFVMWGDVDGTAEWDFCFAIARAIINASARTFKVAKAIQCQP
jgi:hypothetical protein